MKKIIIMLGLMVSFSFANACSTSIQSHVAELVKRNDNERRIIMVAAANTDVPAIKRVAPQIKETKTKILHLINRHELTTQQLSAAYELLTAYNNLDEIAQAIVNSTN